MNEGVCIVAYGANAINQARNAVAALRAFTSLPVTLIGETHIKGAHTLHYPDNDPGARLAKLHLDKLTPYKHTLYMDADTVVLSGDIASALLPLRDGWDMTIAPSTMQGAKCFTHLGDTRESKTTFNELRNPDPLQLQGGVMAFKRGAVMTELFALWREEWQRWQDKDQAALLRALDRMEHKPHIWLLSNEFNGGDVVQHNFGKARRA
jgi:hypothetical protein